MKNKKCKTKGCKNLINSKYSKSGLCGKCSNKEYRKTHKSEIRKFLRSYYLKHRDKYREEINKRTKEYYKTNKKELIKYHKEYYGDNKEKCIKDSEDYYKNNKKSISKRQKKYVNKRYKEDECFKIRKRLGSALNRVLFHYSKTGIIRHPLKKYDIDWDGIISILIPFPEDRENYHVDHIKPFCSFDLTDLNQVREVMKPENHRWMLAKENLRKGGKRVNNLTLQRLRVKTQEKRAN